MTNDYFGFRGVSHYGQSLVINSLEQNLKSWIDWNMLLAGAFENVYTGTTNIYGGDFSLLQPLKEPSHTDYTIFQAPRKQFCYENSGVNYQPPNSTGLYNPLVPQVYINGALTTTGFYINYELGQVCFSGAQLNKTIRCSYSFRSAQTYIYQDEFPFFEIEYGSLDPRYINNILSGTAVPHSAQLPAIIVEGVSQGTSIPFELGTLVGRQKQDVLFHIVAEDRFSRNNIADIFRLQQGKSIILYDVDKINTSGYLPLDYRGMKVDNIPSYPNIVTNNNLIFREAYIDKINITDIVTHHSNLHWAVVRATLEIIL